MTNDPSWKAILSSILADFGCQTGTIHQAAPDGKILTLVCQTGVPESLMDKISTIPFGKGIAGCAAQRKEAVQLCNLQEDLGGVAKPDAQKTNVQGALAVPIVGADGKVIGVLGIGKIQPYDFTEAEIADLNAVAALISAKI